METRFSNGERFIGTQYKLSDCILSIANRKKLRERERQKEREGKREKNKVQIGQSLEQKRPVIFSPL